MGQIPRMTEEEKAKKISQNFLVSAHSVKDAYDRMLESLSGFLADFQIPTIAVSPIVDIFPYSEELDREISRVPAEEVQHTPTTKGQVFSAPGSAEDEDNVDDIVRFEGNNRKGYYGVDKSGECITFGCDIFEKVKKKDEEDEYVSIGMDVIGDKEVYFVCYDF